ncbi:MAG TPA: aminotransferase class IV [Gemmatimonadaceae bacterium]|nr:aminotransferase class IV [Gemmatimonadaceae bacterium]
MLPLISCNGYVTKASTPLISPFDRGFTLGDGLFETMKVTNGTVWYLDRHLARLEGWAARVGIRVPASLRAWIDDVTRQGVQAGHTEHVLRVTLTRGVALTHGLAGAADQAPTVVIAAFEMPRFSPTVYERGLSVHIPATRRNERAATAGLKTTSYLESVLILRDAIAAGYDDAILLDTCALVAEASASNVFVWREGMLMTPPETCGILPGITRAVVLEMAVQGGIPVCEREISLTELYAAEEIFLTSSLRGIVPVSRVDQRPIGAGVPGERTLQMMACYGRDDSHGRLA